ncbi:phycobiliprotein lyase [Spirulina sp. CS-785/01]|uniref:phycobiliprotein lyase n=1 Tax=Spirulina sp. CS-785/01 TaxID=3021716 RepID=UPI00232BA8A5|nr:phycobiliprotein lyase [Spirulina sp. CS-785/01]MDB9312566.1 phycobiliprotein lyase [Spirulina sp. CS-785/01]
MQFLTQTSQQSPQVLAANFFRESAGEWLSQRRYYTLATGEIQEVESWLTVRFLEQGSPELIDVAERHQFQEKDALLCGARVTWESNYMNQKRKPVQGATVFGVLGERLYRDRGFATRQPVTAQYRFLDPKTMHLYTEYKGSSFEEELKLIGQHYRTRQTIIARAGEEQMIGQYLEKRLC